MSAYKFNIREEIAVRQWQSVISFSTATQDAALPAKVTTSNQSVFEVLP